jgi:trehalose 6-phosphate phosphatase
MSEPALPVSAGLARRLGGSPALILLDVDGTLAPIAPTPGAATVPDETKRIVAALARRPGVSVALVSGRSAADARRVVGVGHVWVIGNHGMELDTPDGDAEVDPRIAPYLDAVAAASARLRKAVANVPGVIHEDKRLTLSVHYRLADPGLVPRLRRVVEEIAGEHDLRVTSGKLVLEIRPPVDIHKGTAVLQLAERLGALTRGATTFFAGDDRTDEDAFDALRSRYADAVTVRVGNDAMLGAEPTRAEFVVPGTDEMRELLAWMLAERTTYEGPGTRAQGPGKD